MDKLTVPDYEITSRVEMLVNAHAAHSHTAKSLEHTLKDLDRGYRENYSRAEAILNSPPPRVKFSNS